MRVLVISGRASYTTILGIDPGLRRTGWGIIYQKGERLAYGAHGVIAPQPSLVLPQRLSVLKKGIETVLSLHKPDEVAIEESFVNADPQSALKLGIARGVCIVTPASMGLPVEQYSPRRVKKTVTGSGKADKAQMANIVKLLLKNAPVVKQDAADALGLAITHAQHRKFQSLTA